MAWCTEFKNCETGELHPVYRSASVCYRGPNGIVHEAPQGCGWCTQCLAIVNAESFESAIPSKIEVARIALSDPDSKEAFLFGNSETAEKVIRSMNALNRFLTGRQSMRRCLKCYSDAIIDLPDSYEFQTPDGIVWERHSWGHASMKTEPEVLLDNEGSPIAG